MINDRSDSWVCSPERVELLIRTNSVNLSSKHRNIIDEMISEYSRNENHKSWAITAERVKVLYAVSKKINQPSAVDIKYVIDKMNQLERFYDVRSDAVFLSAIGLLEFLYQNIDKLSYNREGLMINNSDDQ